MQWICSVFDGFIKLNSERIIESEVFDVQPKTVTTFKMCVQHLHIGTNNMAYCSTAARTHTHTHHITPSEM